MTEVATPQPAAVNGNGVDPAVTAEAVKPAAESTSAANGTSPNGDAAKTNGSAKAKKEAEPPKDPKEDTLGWLKQQHNAAIHKVNFYVLDWLQKAAIEDESKRPVLPLKGGKEEAVTRGQFQAHLKDGQLLAHFANKLAPGSVETVHEGEAAKDKSNQTANIQAFLNFIKEKAGFNDDQIFSVEDLQERGKAGYDAVINTLFQLAFRVQEKFGQAGLELEQVVEEVKKVVDPNFFQKVVQAIQTRFAAIINAKFTRNAGQSQTEEPVAGNTNVENGQPIENGTSPTENSTAKPAEEPNKEAEPKAVASQ